MSYMRFIVELLCGGDIVVIGGLCDVFGDIIKVIVFKCCIGGNVRCDNVKLW